MYGAGANPEPEPKPKPEPPEPEPEPEPKRCGVVCRWGDSVRHGQGLDVVAPKTGMSRLTLRLDGAHRIHTRTQQPNSVRIRWLPEQQRVARLIVVACAGWASVSSTSAEWPVGSPQNGTGATSAHVLTKPITIPTAGATTLHVSHTVAI